MLTHYYVQSTRSLRTPARSGVVVSWDKSPRTALPRRSVLLLVRFRPVFRVPLSRVHSDTHLKRTSVSFSFSKRYSNVLLSFNMLKKG